MQTGCFMPCTRSATPAGPLLLGPVQRKQAGAGVFACSPSQSESVAVGGAGGEAKFSTQHLTTPHAHVHGEGSKRSSPIGGGEGLGKHHNCELAAQHHKSLAALYRP